MTARLEVETFPEVDIGFSVTTLVAVDLVVTIVVVTAFVVQLSDTDVTVTACDFTAVTLDRVTVFVLVGILLSGFDIISGEEVTAGFEFLAVDAETSIFMDNVEVLTVVVIAGVSTDRASGVSVVLTEIGVVFVVESDTGIGADFLA